MKILYLHGFRSTPNSAKANQLREYLSLHRPDVEFLCPQLPVSPKAAIELIETLLDQIDRANLTLIGSSLGGFYATHLAECLSLRAVLLNPAITPQRDLKKYLGNQTVYGSDQTIEVRAEYLDELEALDAPVITKPRRYFLLAAKGDELIDWRQMVDKYRGAEMRIIEGSNHGISDFSDHIEVVINFAGAG